MTHVETPPIEQIRSSSTCWKNVSLLMLLSAALYLPGINWGLPSVVSWSQDTIAGMRTLGAVPTWPEGWMGRYPPLQYMILRAAYQPLISHWKARGELTINPETGIWDFAPPHPPKMGKLLLIARLVSVAMALGAIIAFYFAARATTDDHLAAFMAALSFMSGAAFTYFAKLGNVDVPSMLWFALSLLFYFRLIASRKELDAAMLGLFASLTVCTKDGWAGIFPGMAVVLLGHEWMRLRADSARKPLFGALAQWRWPVGIMAFAVPYAMINGVFWNPRAYVYRLGQWLNPAPEAWISREHRHGHLDLVAETARQAAAAVGWPMFVALCLAAIYGIIHRRKLALALLIPTAGYYLIVIERIDFVYERFLFAPLMMLCVLLGGAAADLVRNLQVSPLVRFFVPLVIFLPTLANAIAIDVEMISDSRYAAEEWFRENVSQSASVGAVTENVGQFSPQYLPRVHEMGYATYPVECSLESFNSPQPDYLILSGFDHQDFNETAMRCAQQLLAGRLGYEPLIVFKSRYLGTGSSWLAFAGWYSPIPGKISPPITIFRRAKDLGEGL